MQVGQQAETIEVARRRGLLRTEDATLGSVVEQKRIVELPLNGRNFGQLATLMPGVVYGVPHGGERPADHRHTAMPGQIVGISANGQRDTNQNITLDGVVAVDGFKSAMLFVPSVEAVEEFKMQSAVYSAEYGMNSGVQANVAIKSGTNQFHGTAFEFLRNDTLDARGFFLPPAAQKNKLRRNQFGGVVSGPMIRDKTFWLANYEGRRESSRNSRATCGSDSGHAQRGFFGDAAARNRWYPHRCKPGSHPRDPLPGQHTPFPQ